MGYIEAVEKTLFPLTSHGLPVAWRGVVSRQGVRLWSGDSVTLDWAGRSWLGQAPVRSRLSFAEPGERVQQSQGNRGITFSSRVDAHGCGCTPSPHCPCYRTYNCIRLHMPGITF